MAAQNNAQTIALQLEKVRDKVPLLYERDDVLLSMIQQRGDVEKVSSRNMRLPLQVIPGGKAGSYNADGGDLGRGSGTSYDVAQVSPIFFRFAVEISKLVEYASNAREKAIENAAKREVANGMKQFRAFLDKVIQTAGNGVLGTISAISSNTFTMTVPTGAALVYVGQTIQIYDPTLTTNRNVAASVVSNVTAADPISSTQTITVDNVPAGTVRQRRDRARRAHRRVSRCRSSASSITRTTPPPAPGSTSTARPIRSNCRRRASMPANSALVPGYVRLAINKVRKALGIGQLGKLIAYTCVEQEHAWENLGITIQPGDQGRRRAAAPTISTCSSPASKTMSGVPIKSSINADQTRVDFLDLSHWGRAVMKDIDFFEVGGQTVFPIYGTAAAFPRRSFSTSTPASRCGTTLRAAALHRYAGAAERVLERLL